MPIPISEVAKLPREKQARAGVSNEDLLAQLTEQGMTTQEVAAFLGVKTGTAYSRLRRLLEAGKVEVRYQGARAIWIKAGVLGSPETEAIE